MKSPDTLLTPREAAAAIGVSYPAIKQWIIAGKLRTIKTPDGHHRIPQSALKRYLPAASKASQHWRPRASAFATSADAINSSGPLWTSKSAGCWPRLSSNWRLAARTAHHLHHHRRRRARDAAPQRPIRRCPHEVHRSDDCAGVMATRDTPPALRRSSCAHAPALPRRRTACSATSTAIPSPRNSTPRPRRIPPHRHDRPPAASPARVA